MKIKKTILTALVAFLGLMGVAYGQSSGIESVRISNITTSTATGSGSTDEPLPAGSVIYFDVELEVPSTMSVSGNTVPSTSNVQQRPYLQLDIPMKGTSQKPAGLNLFPNESATEETQTAVAYYIGQGGNAKTLRFAYVVRPGDLSSGVSYALSNSQPIVRGAELIALAVMDADGNPGNVALSSSNLTFQSGVPGAPTKYPVNGYTLTVGDAGGNNETYFFTGLTPVTLAPDGDSVTQFTSASLANQNCYVWTEYKDEDGTWKQIPAGVTLMTTGAEAIKVGNIDNDLIATTTFNGAYAARCPGNRNEARKLFISVPESTNFPANDINNADVKTIRVCFGVPPTNSTTQTSYSWFESTFFKNPVVTTASGRSYSVNGSLEKPATIDLSGTNDATLSGTISENTARMVAGAGETFTVTINRALNNVTETPLYAVIESLIDDNPGVSPNQYYMPLTGGSNAAKIEFTVSADASVGRALYRIVVPALEKRGDATGTVDNPFYLEVETAPYSETIMIQPAEATGSTESGVEYFDPMPTIDPNNPTAAERCFLQYTLSVDTVSDTPRYFLIHPVAEDGTPIRKGQYQYLDAEGARSGRDPFDVISEAIHISNSGSNANLGDADHVVTIRAGETSANFYVALLNDFPIAHLGGVAEDAGGNEITVLGYPSFRAAGSNSTGSVISGTADVSDTIAPDPANREPSIISTPNFGTGIASGTMLTFNFAVADAVGDYLIVDLTYGDGARDRRLIVDEDRMVTIMGREAWDQERARLMQQYGLEAADIMERTTNIKGRENLSFQHAYTDTNLAEWNFTVTDSSGEANYASGTITLSTAQTFTFYLLYTPTRPGSGYVTFDNEADASAWSWGSTFTFKGLPKSGNNTTVNLHARPFAAGTTNPPGGTFTNQDFAASLSPDHDSFFYKWSDDVMETGLLPDGDTIHEPVISISRAFSGQGGGQGGGNNTDASTWQDIVLRAIFVAEYAPGDAITAYENPTKLVTPESHLLGDYNQDGVPDGWLLYALGQSADTRAVVEGTSQYTVPEGDNLPERGWADAAYRYGAAAGQNPGGSFALTGTPFSAKMRVRGRDENHLNAANTNQFDTRAEHLGGPGIDGAWLSHVAWRIQVRPEVYNVNLADYGVNVGNVNRNTGNTYTASWRVIDLATYEMNDDIRFTENGIPYSVSKTEQGNTDWHVVYDSAGRLIQSAADPAPVGAAYRYTTVYVNTRAGDDDYEQMKVVYSGQPWGYYATSYVYYDNREEGDVELRDDQGNPYFDAEFARQSTDNQGNPVFDAAGNPVYDKVQRDGKDLEETFWVSSGAAAGAPFPYMAAPAGGTPVSQLEGQVWDVTGAYYFDDTRVAAGMLIDEVFYNRSYTDLARGENYITPRLTGWLERFSNGTSADQDNDDMPNGYEYYFWYYASRIAYGSVFQVRDANGVVTQQQMNTAIWPAIDMRRRTGVNQGNGFVMGRRFNNGYDPDRGNGQGNLWTPISAAEIMNAFHPLVQGDSGLDLDNDGLSILEEIALGTNPIDFDSDGDGIPDGWEAAFELDPLNANDAAGNPDGDFYATATVRKRPEYHTLFRVQTFKEGVTVPQNHVAYYDYECGKFVSCEDGADEIEHTALYDLTATFAQVQAWDTNTTRTAIYREIVTLSDFDVYQALGFNPMTGWFGGLPTGANTSKFGHIRSVNTAPFTSLQEFNSSVRSVNRVPPATGVTIDSIIARSVSANDPTKADTNNDGIPDGWANYVGFTSDSISGNDQDGDGLTAAQEFQNRVANLWVDDPNKPEGSWPTTLKSVRHEVGGATWANKLLPTDPWDPDTDGDGVLDGDEGVATLCYGPTSDSYSLGGGCDPNELDTDADGMIDGWEFRYAAKETDFEDANGEAATDDTAATEDNAAVAIENYPAGFMDPTNINDRALDYDRDGLTNYQEYLTGILRHLRYDLGPDAARIYAEKAKIGTVTVNENLITGTKGYTLTDLTQEADAFTLLDDLAFELSVPSYAYDVYLNENGEVAGDVTVHVYKQAWAADVNPGARQASTAFRPVIDQLAFEHAINRKWLSNVIDVTQRQQALYGYDNHGGLQARATELDMLTMLRHEANRGGRPYAPAYNATRAQSTLLHIIDAVSAEVAGLPATAQGATGQFAKDTQAIWAARRIQLLNLFGITDQVAEEPHPAYRGMNQRLLAAGFGGVEYHTNYAWATDLREVGVLGDAEASGYEQALVNATHPAIQSQYRSIIRGLNGGIFVTANGRAYVAPIGYHAPFQRFSYPAGSELGTQGRVQGAAALSVGNPIAIGGDAGIGQVSMPYSTTTRDWDPFVTTNPRVSDSDADGMDDHWEIFHGLNPILGDYSNIAYGNADQGVENYNIDKIHGVYSNITANAFNSEYLQEIPETEHPNLFIWVAEDLAPTGKNSFAAPALEKNAVTGYDYYSYPWLAGVPFADPDGDGLINSEEAVNPNGNATRYGTDPSPLWMTDPNNPNSLVTRFYGRGNRSTVIRGERFIAEQMDAGVIDRDATNSELYSLRNAFAPSATTIQWSPGTAKEAGPAIEDSLFPYEINEGFDTDGDGVPDMSELAGTTRGDPQSLRTPSSQQTLYVGGTGALQTMSDVHFGPYALQTFTIEAWIKPDATQNTDEVILIDRPWRFYESNRDSEDRDLGALRHNFRVGLTKVDGGYTAFADYTSAGTTANGGEGTPEYSKKATSGTLIPADKWTHIAVTYDGATLTIYINGAQSGAVTASLIPANGLISVMNTEGSDVQRYTYRSAPIIIGAGPSTSWTADLLGVDLPTVDPKPNMTNLFEKHYKGYIDEVRIWDGVRTQGQIAANNGKSFSQSDLLQQRYEIFMARNNGSGLFEQNLPASLLAMYTFDELLAGTRKPVLDGEGKPVTDENDNPVYEPADEPTDRYPGQHSLSGTGSLLARRDTLAASIERAEGDTYAPYPETVEEVFTTYYMGLPEGVRSAFFSKPINGVVADFVPLAHSTIAHLPLGDVEPTSTNLFYVGLTTQGSPELTLPSGTPLNVKPADSVYWTPYGAGLREGASTTAVYPVKVTGNPYAYVYHATTFFDMPTYRNIPAFQTQMPADLFLLGDAYARYDSATWADGSPTTDPGDGTDDGDGGTTVIEGDMGWFEHGSGSNTDRTDPDSSKGGDWLEDNIGRGQTTDTDQDLMPDWWENHYTLDPEDPTGDNGPHGDPDGDYLTNYAEWLAKSNPNNPSTAGNGVPDFHIPIWARRGRPTFGLLYTDNDFMEDHWEAQYYDASLTVDHHDAYADTDNDGWSNWAEARANFRTGKHSTNPLADKSPTASGGFINEFPTPALRLTVDYFGDQNVYTNTTADTSLIVHAYTVVGNNSEPDAVYQLPLTTVAGGTAEVGQVAREMGYWRAGTLSGYVHMGNIRPGSFNLTYTYGGSITTDGATENTESAIRFTITDKQIPKAPDQGELVFNRQNISRDPATGDWLIENVSEQVGTITYSTGEYTLDFSAKGGEESIWTDGQWLVATEAPEVEGTATAEDDRVNYIITAYPLTEFSGVLTANYALQSGNTNTFTLVDPISGHLREGNNNLFVFVDFNGNKSWDKGEPAGVPDQHDLDIGYDQVNRTLHVQLTEAAPPGAFRYDLGNVLSVLKDELTKWQADPGSNSSDSSQPNSVLKNAEDAVTTPTTTSTLNPLDFADIVSNDGSNVGQIAVTLHGYIGLGSDTVSTTAGEPIFRKPYNSNKPYISEDEIFAQHPTGIPAPEDAPAISKVIYMIYLLPPNMVNTSKDMKWHPYAVAAVTNTFTEMKHDLTGNLPAGEGIGGGTVIYNTDLVFAWTSNVQVPTFDLTITKTKALGATPSDGFKTGVVFKETVRGVSAYAKDKGNETSSGVQQYRYRYVLPRGIGELSGSNILFGDGEYRYDLTLHPYTGESKTLTGAFTIRLRNSGKTDGVSAIDLREDPNYVTTTPDNTENSYYIRTRVRYTGVLRTNEDFSGARVRIEAHRSASFNGDPIAANSDVMAYDMNDDGTEFTDASQLNRTIKISKGSKYQTKVPEPPSLTGEETDPAVFLVDAFYTTDIDAEIRGLPTDEPVYLMAYLDLNANGKRDRWEPWGYPTQGKDAAAGFYFDPLAVTPVRSGTGTTVEFYIQDVDIDNDKLADSFEWLASGCSSNDFNEWKGNLTGGAGNQQGQAIWVYDHEGRLALTAYGAQLLGFRVESVDPETGAVYVVGLPKDLTDLRTLLEIVDEDVALELVEDGITSFGLKVNKLDYDAENQLVTITWDIVGAVVDTDKTAPGSLYDGTIETFNLNKVLSASDSEATFAVYGKTNLDDPKWRLLKTVTVTGSMEASATPTTTVDLEELEGLEEEQAKFFKVILTPQKPATTI